MRHFYVRAFLILIAIILSSLCYIYGYRNQTAESKYTGIRSLNASDFNQHLSFIDQCRKGEFFIQNRFTSEPHKGFLVRPIYFLLAIPFRFVAWSNSSVFHIMRVACGLGLLIAIFPLLRSYEIDSRTEIIAFLLLVFTSGIGILTREWLPETIDMSVPESILFLSLGEAPHFLFSTLFLWSGIAFFYLSIVRGGSLYLAGYFLCLITLWWEHPFDAVIVIGVTLPNLLFLRSAKHQIITILGIGFVSLPAFLYYQKLKTLPAYSGWASSQNLMSTSSVLAVISGIFPLLIFALPGMLTLWKDQKRRQMLLFLGIWAVTQLILIYLPFPFQRRLIAGIQFPLAILAACSIKKFSNAVIAIIIVALMSTNIFMTTQFIKEVRRQVMPFYLPTTYKDAFGFLAQQKNDGAVLSEFVTGNFIPAYSGHPSFMGHSSLTPEILKKKNESAQFYRNPNCSFLQKSHIRYVFWGNEEKNKNGKNFKLNWPVVYRSNQIIIYQMPPSGACWKQ